MSKSLFKFQSSLFQSVNFFWEAVVVDKGKANKSLSKGHSSAWVEGIIECIKSLKLKSTSGTNYDIFSPARPRY